jgi:hypothetical protein
MSTVYGSINTTHLNRKQVQVIARNLNIFHDNSATIAGLVTAIKAK